MTEPGSRPTVLLIGPVPPPSFGVARATQLMLESPVLTARVELVHLDTSDPRSLANMGRLDGRNVYLAVKHLGQLVWFLVSVRPDLVLLTASQSRLALLRDWLFVMVSKVFGTRVVVYLRGSGYGTLGAREGRLAARMLHMILRSSSRVLVLGESLLEMATTLDPRASITVAPNGCPPAVSPDHVGQRQDRYPLVLYMGLLSQTKGLDDLLDASRIVVRHIPTLRFVLCGHWDPPEYEAAIRSQVNAEGLSDNFAFPGPVDGPEKEGLLSRAWLLVVPSHSEGQPWVILEAMSAGIPVVATDTGTVAETIEDGVSGYVVRVGDSKTLAERVIILVEDEQLWYGMSSQAVRRYQERFTLDMSHSILASELLEVALGD